MKLIRPIASVFLAVLVLISTVGVTINLHLCAGQVQSIALFVKAPPCKNMQMACHRARHHSKKNGCCEEQSIVLKGKATNAEVKTATQIHPSFNLIAVILPVLYSIIDLDPAGAVPLAYYKPPLIDRDINVLVRSFLI